MHAFAFTATDDVDQALRLATADSAFLAGGTTLVDLMKLDVMAPRHVIDINGLDLCGITVDHKGLRIGAMARMADVATHRDVGRNYPVLTQALLLGASGQVRNMASVGGNLLQRTRCDYFRDVRSPCNKRAPGSGCPAQTGENRNHAVLGTSTACVATHPSDLAVALVALGASVRLRDRKGTRQLELSEFYRLPGETPHLENQLRPGELITDILVPALPWARRSTYVKIRDRSSFEFALASVAVALDLRDGTVHSARIAVGGVGTRPWRLPSVENALRGHPPTPEHVEAAAAHAAEGARPLAHNGFKVKLIQRTIVSVTGSTHVWVDHNTFTDGDNPDSAQPRYFGRPHQAHDGALDVTNASNFLTVSWNRFADHDKTMLIGSTNNPANDRGKLNVTVHHNHFRDTLQRMPRVRFGQVHVYNNFYEIPESVSYVLGVGVESAIVAESNVFALDSAVDPGEVLFDWGGTVITARDNLLCTGRHTEPADLVALYNATHDPDLGTDAGWTPTLHTRITLARHVPALVSRQAGARTTP